MRNWFPILLTLALLPTTANPVGLGDIRLHSALNQPLRAEIELLSVSADEERTLAAALPGYDVFERLGVDRPALLSQLTFTVVKRENGTFFIDVRSDKPIREPFLDFLLEVNWRSGRLMREYTVLLDPPEMKREAPPSIQAPSTAIAAKPAPVAPAQTIATATVQSAPVPAPTPRSTAAVQPAPAATPAPASRSGSGKVVQYGPVGKVETLWSIANKLRPDSSVSPQQVMLALLKANPDSFENGNVNGLKKGSILRFDPALAREMSPQSAYAEAERQDRAWLDYKGQAGQQGTNRPTTVASGEKPATAPSAQGESPRLKLVAPQKGQDDAKKGAAGSGKGKRDLESLQKELMLALEASEAAKQKNTDLLKRIDELSGQIAAMERLIALKDEDLASLQRKLQPGGQQASTPAKGQPQPVAKAGTTASVASAPAAGNTKPAAGSQAPVTAVSPQVAAVPGAAAKPATAPVPLAGQAPASGATAAAPAASPEPGAQPANGSGAVVPPEGATATVEGEGLAPAAAPAVVEKPKVAPKPAPRPAPAPVQEPGMGELFSQLLSNPVMLGALGVAGLSIIGLILLIIRRRRRGPDFQESILTGSVPASAVKSKAGEGSSSEETSFFSDFAVSGMSHIHTEDTEVDPLTEADVYMAYGRYQQAEDLLKEAIKAAPTRPELHLKLLEVYFSTKNSAQFEAAAVASRPLLEGANWDKAVVMGNQLVPDNPLFKDLPANAGAASVIRSSGPQATDVLDIGLELDALAAEYETETSQAPSSERPGGDLDFDLGLDFTDLESNSPVSGKEETRDEEGRVPLPSEVEEPVSFDLDDFSLPAEPTTAAAPSPSSGKSEVFDGADLDFDLDALGLGSAAASSPAAAAGSEPEPRPAAPQPAAPEPAGLDLDFDLGMLADLQSSAEAMQNTAAAVADEHDIDFSSFDLGELGDLSGPESAAKEKKESAPELDLSLDFATLGDENPFGELDEVGTKLDLARAYVEMGDAEGAKSILDEVVREGNADQKREAEQLIKQIA